MCERFKHSCDIHSGHGAKATSAPRAPANLESAEFVGGWVEPGVFRTCLLVLNADRNGIIDIVEVPGLPMVLRCWMAGHSLDTGMSPWILQNGLMWGLNCALWKEVLDH
jgi:hypothetical protein